MSRLTHARLDPQSEQLLREIERRLGWSDSRVVREGIKALSAVLGPQRRRQIVGLGAFQSGVRDLGSNKAHLKGFGH